MTEQEDNTENITYMVDILDNGITLTIPEQDFMQCEKFSKDGKTDDEAIIKFLGRNLWEDIRSFADYRLTNDIKIKINLSVKE